MKTPTIRRTGKPRRSHTKRRRWNTTLTRKIIQKIDANPFPERRKTNKFRESHPRLQK